MVSWSNDIREAPIFESHLSGIGRNEMSRVKINHINKTLELRLRLWVPGETFRQHQHWCRFVKVRRVKLMEDRFKAGQEKSGVRIQGSWIPS